MPTVIIPIDRLDEVRAGDRLVAIDDVQLDAAKVFTDGPQRVWPNGPIGIPFDYGGSVPAYLYAEAGLIERSITIERDEVESERDPELDERVESIWGPECGVPIAAALSPGTYIPEEEIRPADEHGDRIAPSLPAVFLHERERKALRRNRHYERALRLLNDPDGNPVDLREVVSRDNYFDNPRSHSHTAGILATFYGWTEQTASYTWRLTPSGRRALAAIDAGGLRDRR